MNKFTIYTRKYGFHNKDYLNSIGKEIFELLEYLKKYHNKYFHRINSITVTSLLRTDNPGSAHYYNKAIDIITDPVEYMPYLYGVIHAVRPYNIYLGPANSLHIHIDNWYDNYRNRKGIETDAGVKAGTTLNIDETLKNYGFGLLTSIQDFGIFDDKTRKLYLTYYKINEKLSINDFVEFPPADKFSWLAALAIIGFTFYIYKKRVN